MLLNKVKQLENLQNELRNEKQMRVELALKIEEKDKRISLLEDSDLEEINDNLQFENKALKAEISQLNLEMTLLNSQIDALTSKVKEEQWKAQEGNLLELK
jgi:hypothetical protein